MQIDDGIAAFVLAERKRLGISQIELARRAGVAQPTVTKLEAGGTLTWRTLRKVMAAIGYRVVIEPVPVEE